MAPETYFRIVLLTMQRELLGQLFVEAFGIADFLATGGEEILKNVGAQLAGYTFGVLTDRPVNPEKFLPPIISSAQPTYDFITQVTGVTRAERVAAIALTYAAAGAWAKIGDVPFNGGIGGCLFLLTQFIQDNANNGNTPFLLPKTSRKSVIIRRNFSTKKLIQSQLVLTGCIVVFIGATWCIVYILRQSFKYGFKQGYKIKSKNPLKNLNLRKNFKSKAKVQFIPLH